MFGAAHAGRLMSPKHRGQAKRDLKVRQERLGDWEKEKEVRIKKLIAQGYRVSRSKFAVAIDPELDLPIAAEVQLDDFYGRLYCHHGRVQRVRNGEQVG